MCKGRALRDHTNDFTRLFFQQKGQSEPEPESRGGGRATDAVFFSVPGVESPQVWQTIFDILKRLKKEDILVEVMKTRLFRQLSDFVGGLTGGETNEQSEQMR